MIRGFTVGLVLAVASNAFAAEIADVRTLDDLLALAPIEAAGGYKVRVGISDAGPAAGPVMVLYCWAERSSGAATRPTTGESYDGAAEELGPLLFEIAWPLQDRIEQRRRLVQIQEQIGPSLYAASVPLEPLRKAKVVMRDRAETLVAERALPIERPPHVWHAFVREVFGKNGAVSAVVADEPSPAVVRLCGGIPRNDGPPTTRPASMTLFRIEDDPSPQSPLTLSLHDGAFVLKCSAGKLLDLPAELLLARWWVNGKPVAAMKDPKRRQHAMQQARAVRETGDLRIAFGLPDFLGDVKAGDRVSVQVIYSPDGWEPVSVEGQMRQMMQRMQRLRSMNAPLWPIVSNRIEFVLTEEMLKERDHPIESK